MRTLYDIASEMEDDYAAGCVLTLAKSSEVFIGLPFTDIPGGAFAYNVEGVLPGVAFRSYEKYAPKGAKILNPAVETLKIVGSDMDVDLAITRTHGMAVRANHVDMKLKAIGLNFVDTVINGNSDGNPRVFDGLRRRIVGDGKLKYNISKTLPWNVQQLVDMVPGCTHLITSKAQRRHLTACFRRGDGQISYTKHEPSGTKLTNFIYEEPQKKMEKSPFDIAAMTVSELSGVVAKKTREIPILIADYSDTGQRIINDGAVLAVNFSDGFVTCLANGDPHVRDFGEIAQLPVYRTRMEWYATLAIMHGEGAAILYA